MPRALKLCLAVVAAISCSDGPVGPFRDPNFVPVPTVFDSAFGSGTAKWFSTRTFDTITAAALDASNIYSADNDSVAGPSLVALQITSGVLRWGKALTAPATDIVVAGTTVGAVSTSVTAFDVTSGASRFNYTPPNPRHITSNGAGDSSRIFVGNRKGELVALNASTGAEVWSPTIDTAAVTGVTLSGDTVYAAGNGFLAAVNATTGATIWKKVITDSPKPTGAVAPAVDSGRVTIVGSPAASAAVANYNAATGVFGWSAGSNPPPVTTEAPGSFACDGYVLAGSNTVLTAFQTATGAVKWSRGTSTAYSKYSASCSHGTVVANGRVDAAGGSYNEVHILRASDGGPLLQLPKTTGTHLRIRVVLRDATRIYFLTDQGITAIAAPSLTP